MNKKIIMIFFLLFSGGVFFYGSVFPGIGIFSIDKREEAVVAAGIVEELFRSWKVPYKSYQKWDGVSTPVVFCFNQRLNQKTLQKVLAWVKEGGVLFINGYSLQDAGSVKVSVVANYRKNLFFYLNKPVWRKVKAVNIYHEAIPWRKVECFSDENLECKPYLMGIEWEGEEKFSLNTGKRFVYLGEIPYGKGEIVYFASHFPFFAFGDSYLGEEFVFLKNKLKAVFKKKGLPLYSIFPWPSPYRAAVWFRHDFDRRLEGNYPEWLEDLIKEYVKIENSCGAKGNYFFTFHRLEEAGGRLHSFILQFQDKMNIFSHGYEHKRFDTNPDLYTKNILKSFKLLDEFFHRKPFAFVFPFYEGNTPQAHQLMEKEEVKLLGEEALALPYPFFTIEFHLPSGDKSAIRKYKHLQIPLSVIPLGNEGKEEIPYSNIGETLSDFSDNPFLLEKLVENVYQKNGIICLYTHFRKDNFLPYQRYGEVLKRLPYLWYPQPEQLYNWWIQRDKVEFFYENGRLKILNKNSDSISIVVKELISGEEKKIELLPQEKVKLYEAGL